LLIIAKRFYLLAIFINGSIPTTGFPHHPSGGELNKFNPSFSSHPAAFIKFKPHKEIKNVRTIGW
jgi:hypothetical protein